MWGAALPQAAARLGAGADGRVGGEEREGDGWKGGYGWGGGDGGALSYKSCREKVFVSLSLFY